MRFWHALGQLWCSVVTSVSFSGNLQNCEKNAKNPQKNLQKKIQKSKKPKKIQKIQENS